MAVDYDKIAWPYSLKFPLEKFYFARFTIDVQTVSNSVRRYQTKWNVIFIRKKPDNAQTWQERVITINRLTSPLFHLIILMRRLTVVCYWLAERGLESQSEVECVALLGCLARHRSPAVYKHWCDLLLYTSTQYTHEVLQLIIVSDLYQNRYNYADASIRIKIFFIINFS